MEPIKREEIEAKFKELPRHNPMVHKVMMLHRCGDLSEREAMMYAVLVLADENKRLTGELIKALRHRPPQILPAESDLERFFGCAPDAKYDGEE